MTIPRVASRPSPFFKKQPPSLHIRTQQGRAFNKAAAIPRYLISDFDSDLEDDYLLEDLTDALAGSPSRLMSCNTLHFGGLS